MSEILMDVSIKEQMAMFDIARRELDIHLELDPLSDVGAIFDHCIHQAYQKGQRDCQAFIPETKDERIANISTLVSEIISSQGDVASDQGRKIQRALTILDEIEKRA